VRRSSGRWSDLLDLATEALEAIAGRRGRSGLTLAGVILGIVALVATIGITSTAAAQISGQFDALKATQVTIEGFDDPSKDLTATGLIRVSHLNGVVAAGPLAMAGDGQSMPMVSRVDGDAPSAAVATSVLAASPSALDALRVRATSGRTFDDGDERRRDPVVLLGHAAASGLGITAADGDSLIFINGRPFLLMGIVDTPVLDSQIPLAAIVPSWTMRAPVAQLSFPHPQVVIRVTAGAAQQVGAEAKVALIPQDPGSLVAQVPPDPRGLAADVKSSTSTLFLLLAAVSLLIGAIGIGNTTLISVLERRAEIGLRRAIGASRRNILVQFLLESGLLGLLGGVLGTMAGVDGTVGLALVKDWTAAIPTWLVVAGPFLGLAVGLLAGAYPAAKASRTEPVQALAG
jgi:putative ABC transport system permease protein